MELANVTPAQLRKAADLQEKIQSLQSELNALLGSPAPLGAVRRVIGARGLSAAGRAAISAAAKARWARLRAGRPASSLARNTGRTISAAGRAKLAAAARERWKKAKAAGKSKL